MPTPGRVIQAKSDSPYCVSSDGDVLFGSDRHRCVIERDTEGKFKRIDTTLINKTLESHTWSPPDPNQFFMLVGRIESPSENPNDPCFDSMTKVKYFTFVNEKKQLSGFLQGSRPDAKKIIMEFCLK